MRAYDVRVPARFVSSVATAVFLEAVMVSIAVDYDVKLLLDGGKHGCRTGHPPTWNSGNPSTLPEVG